MSTSSALGVVMGAKKISILLFSLLTITMLFFNNCSGVDFTSAEDLSAANDSNATNGINSPDNNADSNSDSGSDETASNDDIITTDDNENIFDDNDYTNDNGEEPDDNNYVVDGNDPAPTPIDETQTYTVPAMEYGMADIVFLVDTSGSMQSIQSAIGSRFQDFITSISNGERNIDWRIAITTTNMQAIGGPAGSRGDLIDVPNSDPVMEYLEPNTPNVGSKFNDMITLPQSAPENQGNERPDDERGIYNANLLVDNQTANPGFFRDGADLHMVFVSNENENSNGQNLENYDMPDTLIAKVRDNVFGNRLYAHSVVALNNSSVYQELSNKTNGEILNINSNNYSSVLNSLGQAISNVGTQITLKCDEAMNLEISLVPDPNPGEPVPHQLQGDTLSFVNVLAAGTVVNLAYQCPPPAATE